MLVVNPAPGLPTAAFTDIGPQIVAGMAVEVTAGVAVDALGRLLPSCSPVMIDIGALASQTPTAFQTKACSEWFDEFPGDPCDSISAPITAQQYWLVAEYEERPSRPVPQYSGGGACDPAPSCDFSRYVEGVRFRLVTRLPEAYIVTGCLVGDFPLEPPPVGPSDRLFTERLRYFDGVLAELAARCCSEPVVVLAEILIVTTVPLEPNPLPVVPRYVIINPDYPRRRPVLSAASLTMLAGFFAVSPPPTP